MTLKTRILFLAPLAILGMLLVGAIFYFGDLIKQEYREDLAKMQDFYAMDQDIEMSLLQARRAEKDFLLRKSENDISAHSQVSASVAVEIQKLEAAAKANFPGSLDQEVNVLNSGFAQYVAGFDALVAKNRLLGLDEETGLQGSLRTAVKEAETQLATLEQPELTAKMLMMRRHEKDFIMRVDEKYVGSLNDRVAEFKRFPSTLFGSAANRTTVFNLIDAYQADFQAFAIATLEERGLRAALSADYARIEPALAEIRSFVVEKRNSTASELAVAQENILKVVILVTLLAMAIIGIVAFLVARSVGRPLVATVSALQALARGETGVVIEGKDRKDEIGDIAVAFDACQALAIQKAREEQQAANDREAGERERRAEQDRLDAERKANLETAIGALDTALGRLADGDLTSSIAQPFVGELDNLRVSFNRSVDKLSETLNEIKFNTDSIHGNAGEMRSAVEDLSRRTEQQAASLEETSAALEEITSTVKNSADRAQDASKKAAEANAASESSTVIVADAVGAMSRIENASGEIAKIIGVIDEIAFQTNLLALNAGVEAARAGEAGRGFAVVAQEVRELAQRSAAAAKEIKQLISRSSAEVGSGVELVKATGEALSKIAAHVVDINQHIESIATAAREQSTGLQEVNTAVSQMDQVTQQNAAMVEQATAVTHRLEGEAQGLNDLVGRFQTSTSTGKTKAGQNVLKEVSGQHGAASASPARAMISKVKQAFGGGGSAASAQEWSEF